MSDDPRKARVLELVRDGKTQAEAADEIGVHRVTVSRWRQTDPDFAVAIRRAETAAALEGKMPPPGKRLRPDRSTVIEAEVVDAMPADGPAPAPAVRVVEVLDGDDRPVAPMSEAEFELRAAMALRDPDHPAHKEAFKFYAALYFAERIERAKLAARQKPSGGTDLLVIRVPPNGTMPDA